MWSRGGKRRKLQGAQGRAKAREFVRFKVAYGEVTPDAVKKTWIIPLSRRLLDPK
jgi:hypothetical protein